METKITIPKILPSQDCINLIMQMEGFQSKAYHCPAGKLTIGYGRTENVNEGDTTTKELEKQYVVNKANAIAKDIQNIIKSCPTQGQIDALVDFAYNLGITALSGSTLLKKHMSGDYEAAQKEFYKWTKARVNGVLTELPGLVKRCKFRAALYGK